MPKLKIILLALALALICVCIPGNEMQGMGNWAANLGDPTWSADPAGDIIETRIPVLAGYARVPADNASYAAFLRGQKLKSADSPVILYNGAPKWDQSTHAAVLALDAGDTDLQQCADCALRLRCEYLYARKQYDKIAYHLTNGFLFPYTRYAEGWRLAIDGDRTWLEQSAQRDYSYATFREYLTTLFRYAGTLSISRESATVALADMQLGDVFDNGGTPGHLAIVTDMCENAATGEKAFLLAQGSTPAQGVYVLKNPGHADPWYRMDEVTHPFVTPEYVFGHECLMRMP